MGSEDRRCFSLFRYFARCAANFFPAVFRKDCSLRVIIWRSRRFAVLPDSRYGSWCQNGYTDLLGALNGILFYLCQSISRIASRSSFNNNKYLELLQAAEAAGVFLSPEKRLCKKCIYKVEKYNIAAPCYGLCGCPTWKKAAASAAMNNIKYLSVFFSCGLGVRRAEAAAVFCCF